MNGDQRMPAPAKAQGATPSDDPAAIERDIKEARSELGRTIDELQERLNPSTLKAQATDAVKGATVGRAEEFADSAKETAKGVGTQMMQTMRDNPIPTALTGVGLFWLWRKSRRNGDHQYQPDPGSRTWEAYSRNQPQYSSSGYQGQSGYGYQGSQAQGSMQSGESGGMMSRAGDMASGMAGQAQGAVGAEQHHAATADLLLYRWLGDTPQAAGRPLQWLATELQRRGQERRRPGVCCNGTTVHRIQG